LPENVGLVVHLGLRHSIVDDYCWNNLVGATSKHPTLRMLTFENFCDVNDSGLTGMLSENERVEDIQVVKKFFS
jgi:hypothetical protein